MPILKITTTLAGGPHHMHHLYDRRCYKVTRYAVVTCEIKLF